MKERIQLTTSCRDCDNLPRHPKSGVVEIDASGTKYQYMHDGTKIIWGSYHSPWMNEIIENLKGHHEPQEELCFYYILQTLNDSANMIELGSHWAYYSIWFNRHIKNAYNLCMEPVQSNLVGGASNAKFNNCDNMEFIQGCFGNKYLPEHRFTNWDNTAMVMPMYTLSKLIEQSGRKFFDIVHSDTQGAEVNLMYLDKDTTDNIGYLVVSTHGIPLHNSLIKELQRKQFTILVEHGLDTSVSADGLIIAVNNMHISKYEKNIDGNLIDHFKNNCKITK